MHIIYNALLYFVVGGMLAALFATTIGLLWYLVAQILDARATMYAPTVERSYMNMVLAFVGVAVALVVLIAFQKQNAPLRTTAQSTPQFASMSLQLTPTSKSEFR